MRTLRRAGSWLTRVRQTRLVPVVATGGIPWLVRPGARRTPTLSGQPIISSGKTAPSMPYWGRTRPRQPVSAHPRRCAHPGYSWRSSCDAVTRFSELLGVLYSE